MLCGLAVSLLLLSLMGEFQSSLLVFISLTIFSYIYPYTFRSKMADLFRDRSIMNWWLPQNEEYPAIVRSIRKFVEERTAPAKDMPSEDLRDMKNIFSSLNLDDGEADQNLGTGRELGGGQSWQETEQPQLDYRGAYGDDQEFWRNQERGGGFGHPKPRGYH